MKDDFKLLRASHWLSDCLTFASLTKVLCTGILCVLLVAGLSPFHSPENQVKWMENKSGLQFSRYSSILGSTAFHGKSASDGTSESLEVWLVPSSLRSMNTIVSFDGSDHPGAGFMLRQYKDALIVRQHYIDNYGVPRIESLAVLKALHEGTPVLVTITLGRRGTAIYLDGVLGEMFSARGTSANNLTGRLVVANSPQANDSWPGQILGLAIYRSQLTPSRVAENCEGWTKSQRPTILNNEAPIALYLFEEGRGNIVHNQLDSSQDLVIPKHYFVLHPPFLESIRGDYRPNWHYWEDVSVNVVGFIPLGFWLAVDFYEVHKIRYPMTTILIVGLLTSLMIEILQVFLPTRSSGSTDLITNTLGTAIGIMFYYLPFAQGLLTNYRKLGMRVPFLPSVVADQSAEKASLSA
ncbi:MAG: VanZ family protein [Terriglobales bacterium]